MKLRIVIRHEKQGRYVAYLTGPHNMFLAVPLVSVAETYALVPGVMEEFKKFVIASSKLFIDQLVMPLLDPLLGPDGHVEVIVLFEDWKEKDES